MLSITHYSSTFSASFWLTFHFRNTPSNTTQTTAAMLKPTSGASPNAVLLIIMNDVQTAVMNNAGMRVTQKYAGRFFAR